MNIIVTSLLTLSLLVTVSGCCKQKDRCTAVYIDANNKLQTEELASTDATDTITSQNIKC